MWYIKVSSSLLIAVALICMIQNAISLSIDPPPTDDQWSTLESSTDQNDLKKISKLCKIAINNFNEKLENTKTIANKKLPEPNKTTEAIANLVSDIKSQVKNASADLVTVRKLVQKTAVRFRDTFKSLVSFSELDSESVNKELESIKKITVDGKKPLVNRVVRSFGNRYDLNKLANKVLEISSDRENLKNNYDEKKKKAKKEFNSLWKSLTNHSKTVNDNALKALNTFFEGMKSVKFVKKKVKALGEDALNEIKLGDDINKIQNAVELAKALKLKFEDEWNLDSGELTYSEEQKKATTQTTDQIKSGVQSNEQGKSNNNISTDDVESGLSKTKQETIEKTNAIPSTKTEIEKLSIGNSQTSDKAVSPTEETLSKSRKNKNEIKITQPKISERKHNLTDKNVSDNIESPIQENPFIANIESKEKTVQPKATDNDRNSIDDDLKSDSSIKETSFIPDNNNNKELTTPLKDSTNNKKDKKINKITNREKPLILPWEKLIQLDNPQVSQQSIKCESLLNKITPDFDDIKKTVKNAIQITKNYKNLQKIENDTVKQFYNKMVDTNTKLCDYLVNAADDVCAKISPINKRYEIKFKNDPNIKRIKYLLGKHYDPNQYILKVLDDANHKNGIGGMKKTTYYKMLAVAYNLNHETKEMEAAALYAMNKIYEGKTAATNMKKMFNKEKAAKACYIKNILQEKENEDDKKNKDENKEKLNESLNEENNTQPLKPDVNLDSVDDIQQSTVTDDNEPILSNNDETKKLNEKNVEVPETSKYSTSEETNEGIPSIKPKPKHRRTRIDPKDGKEISEEYDTFEEEDKTNLSKSGETPEHELSSNTDNEHATDTTEPSENVTPEETDEGIPSVIPKSKHRRTRIDPKDGKEISEEYDTFEEEDETDLSKPVETFERELSSNVDNEHDSETPKPTGNGTQDETDDGIPSVKPKPKHRRTRIDPKDGKEISEEYDTFEEEDKNNLSKPGEEPEGELSGSADNKHGSETTETSENATPEETKLYKSGETPEETNLNKSGETPEETDEGTLSFKPKPKYRRTRINPTDGKEISEEYDTFEEKDETNFNKPGEEAEGELSDSADNKHGSETTETFENVTPEETDEGNSFVKSKPKHRRTRIDPTDGNEISEEYDTFEEEDETNLSKTGESLEQDLSSNVDNEHDSEIPKPTENGNLDETDDGIPSVKRKPKHRRTRIDPKDGKEISEEYDTFEEEDETNLSKSAETPEETNLNTSGETPEETDDGISSVKRKPKHRRTRIDPKDGKEISDEYDTFEEDETNLSKQGETLEHELSGNVDDEHDSETPETSENATPEETKLYKSGETPEEINLNKSGETPEETDEGTLSFKPKPKHRRTRIDPKDGKEISEEYDTFEEEDKTNLSKSGETPEHELSSNTDNEHATDTTEPSENVTPEETDEGIPSVIPKSKHRRTRIDPKDGKEISEEYDTFEEEDETDFSKPVETFERELSSNVDNEHDSETPKPTENGTLDESGEGIPSVKPKPKHRRTRIDPKDGKEISEEYDTFEEEDKNNLNKPGEEPEGELSGSADNKHGSETTETSENATPEETKLYKSGETPEETNLNKSGETPEETDEGTLSFKPKPKHRRTRINPTDGKEISEEYDTFEEEDKTDLNKPGETLEHELSSNVDDEHDSETPETSENATTEETKLYKSGETPEETEEGTLPFKPKPKHRRTRIDPKDGKEISDEYDTFEEHETNLSKPGESLEHELSSNVDNDHDSETPKPTENGTLDETDDGIPSVKRKPKHRRTRIDHKDGKEISEEYDTFEEEDETNLRKSGETPEETNLNKSGETPGETDEGTLSFKPKPKHRRTRINPTDGKEISEEYDTFEEEDKTDLSKPGETLEHELSSNVDDEHDSETPETSENATPEETKLYKSGETPEETEEGTLPFKPKPKHRRTRIDPKDGKEISDEYDTFEEHETNLSKPGESLEHELSSNVDNEHDSETTKPTENGTLDETDDGIPSVKRKPKHRRTRIDPKDGKEISEEYDTFEEEDETNLSKPGETLEHELSSNVDNEHDSETPKPTENGTLDESGEGIPSVKPKPKHRRTRIDPKDGKEISEEYDTFEEKDETNFNKPGEEAEGELSDSADNKHGSETTETFEDVTPEETDEGNSFVKSKPKHRRTRIDPTDGNEISEEYDTFEEEDETNLSKTGESLEQDLSSNVDNEHDSEIPKPTENGNLDETDDGIPSVKRKPKYRRTRIDPKDGKEISEEYDTFEEEDETNLSKSGETPEETNLNTSGETPEETDDGISSVKRKPKHRRTRIDPKDGKEISDEYDTFEEEDETDLSKPGETLEHELSSNVDNEHDSETPKPTENGTLDESDEGIPSVKPKPKNRRTRIDPKDGKEISEEYDTFEEEDETNLSKQGETLEHELSSNVDDEYDSETSENATPEETKLYKSGETPEETNLNKSGETPKETDEGTLSFKPKPNHRKTRIDCKDGKEISDEYDTFEEEDETDLSKPGETLEHELSSNVDNEHDSETPKPTENGTLDESDEGIPSVKPKPKHRRTRIDPKDGKEISEEYDTFEEEDETNLSKQGETLEHELSSSVDDEHDSETPETSENATPEETKLYKSGETPEEINLNKSGETPEETDEGTLSFKPKPNQRKTRIDPKDGKEISEEYDTFEEEDETNLSKPVETLEHELSSNVDNEHDSEVPKPTENGTLDETDDGIPSVKPKPKHRRTRIHPKDGKEISEEYDTFEEEDKNNLSKPGEKPEGELSGSADNKHGSETTETSENATPEETKLYKSGETPEETDEGTLSFKPKPKHRRTRINPTDGKEISEEYDTFEEEDETDLSKPGETLEHELSSNVDNEHDSETPKPTENGTLDESDEGIPSVKPKPKHRKTRIDPKDGNEISEEYDTFEEEDKNNLSKPGEKPEGELSGSADNKHGSETTETSENATPEETKLYKSGETPEETDEGTLSFKPKPKHRRTRINPTDGKEISEEYDTFEEEDETDLSKPGETLEHELSSNVDNEHDSETPKPTENGTLDESDEGIPSVKPKPKHRKTRIDPKDGNEISEEYDTFEEDETNLSKQGETLEHELSSNVDDEHDSETPETSENATPEETKLYKSGETPEETEEGTLSFKPKPKHRINPKDGKEISEEYDTFEEEDKTNLTESGVTTEGELSDSADNVHDTETSEPSENITPEETDEGIPSVKPKHYRRRLYPKVDEEIPDEYDTLDGEVVNHSNGLAENKSSDYLKPKLSDNNDGDLDEGNLVNQRTDVDLTSEEDGNTIDQYPQESKSSSTEGDVADIDPENITGELDENENLNSVEGAELNGVDNDNIMQAAESMGVDSSSAELSFEEPEQSNLINSKNSPVNSYVLLSSDDRTNKIFSGKPKRMNFMNGNEISEVYEDKDIEKDNSPEFSKNIDSLNETPDMEFSDNKYSEHDSTPENFVTSTNIQSKEHAVTGEIKPKQRSIKNNYKLNDIYEQNNGGNPPNKNTRLQRNQQDPMNGQEILKKYDVVEEPKTPDLESLDHNETVLKSETIEYYDEIPNNTPLNEYAEIYENEQVPRSIKGNEKLNDNKEENNGDYPPNKQPRILRKRIDPFHNFEISGEHEMIDYEDEKIIKSETPNMILNYPFYEKPRYSPNHVNTISDKKNVVDFPQHKPKGPTNQKNPEYEHEISEEYEFIEENDKHSELKEHTAMKNENHDSNNNVIPNIFNDGSEDLLNTGYDDPINDPQTIDVDNNRTAADLSKFPDNLDLEPEAFSIPADADETKKVDKQRPRKVRRHRKSRRPKNSVSENDTESGVVNDENTDNYPVEDQYVNNESAPYNDHGVDEDVSETEHDVASDVGNNIGQPALTEYPDNSDLGAEAFSIPADADETKKVDKQRPRKVRRHRKSRRPKNSVSENDTESGVVNDENTDNYPVEDQYVNNESAPYNDHGVDEDVSETEHDVASDVGNNIGQPALTEYPDNSDLGAEAFSIPADADETKKVDKQRPRKVRRHRKSRRPKNSVSENDTESGVVNDENTDNYPVKDQYVNNESAPYSYHGVDEDVSETEHDEVSDVENNIGQPALSEYPDNSDLGAEAFSIPADADETKKVDKQRPRKVRRHRKSRRPKNSVSENDTESEVVNDENTDNYPVEDQYVNYHDIPHNHKQEEAPITYKSTVESSDYIDGKNNVDKSSNMSNKLQEKSRKPNENVTAVEPKRFNPTGNNKHVNYEEDSEENENLANLNDTDSARNSEQPGIKKHVRTKEMPTKIDMITPNNLDIENSRIQNDEKTVTENPETLPNDTERNPKKRRLLRRIRTYMVNKATNERIPINDQTYSTTDGLPETLKNRLESDEGVDYFISDNLDTNTDNDDYSSFLFKEYNSDQCKRDAYDRFKKVASQDAKQIAYRSVLDTSEMRSSMLATVKNAIGNVKVSKTFNDVDQSLRTVSYSLKTGLKQTVSDLVTKVIPLAKDFLKTAENLKELYQNGPQSTHKMLSNILENDSTVPDSAKDILKLISPQFNVDELVNKIFEKPCNVKSLKEKKVRAQRKLIDLSKHMDTAISNIDCFVLSAMSAVGIGADTLKLLKSGRVIMSDYHPRAKTLRDAVGIIKSGKKIRNNDVGFTPTLTSYDGTTESDEDDDDEDPDQVAQKNEEFLKTIPDLDENIHVPQKVVPNKRQSLGVIVVHPDKQIEYKEVTDTSELKKFVGDQTKKYKLQSTKNHPKFLKLNSKKLIDTMVADVKKKAERNGMSKKEMVEEIIKNLNSS